MWSISMSIFTPSLRRVAVVLSSDISTATRRATQGIYLISPEQIPCIDLLFHVFEGRIEAVGEDHVGTAFELLQIVYDDGAEEGLPVFEGWFIDDDCRALGLHAFHHALDGRLAEIIAVVLHRQAIDTNRDGPLLLRIPDAVGCVIPCLLQHTVGDEVLSGAVALDNRPDELFGNIVVVCEKLLGVLDQAVSAVAKGRVVIMGPNAWIKAYSVDNLLSVQALYLGIGIQRVEDREMQRQIGVGKELDRLSLGEAHEPGLIILLHGALLQEPRKPLSRRP